MSDHRWDETGEQIKAGVHRIPLPLPGDALRAVNAYLLEADDGLTLIDAGWDDSDTREALAGALERLSFEPGDVRRVLVTHIHRDHVGQASHLARTIGAEVSLGEAEKESLAFFIANPKRNREDRFARLHRCGADELLPRLRADATDRAVDWDMPDRYVHDGQRLQLGSRELVVMATPGHTKGHVCFFEPTTGLLFSGDHVLPHITPSIGFEPQPTSHALEDFLSSLARIRNIAASRVLPAHGPVFQDLGHRVDELAAHHEHRLHESFAALAGGPATPYEAARRLRWTRRLVSFTELNPFNQMLATLETLAHLELLESQGRVGRRETPVWEFSQRSEPA